MSMIWGLLLVTTMIMDPHAPVSRNHEIRAGIGNGAGIQISRDLRGGGSYLHIPCGDQQ
jgi:hypothetical protein